MMLKALRKACRDPENQVATLIGLYIVLQWLISMARLFGFGYNDFDLAIHTQSVRNILHGSLDSSILGIPFLGNHFCPILFLVAPLYALFPSPLLLLLLQTVGLGLGGLGLYRIAQQRLSPTWAMGILALYLTYPPLLFLNLYEFHPIALATAFLIGMLHQYEHRRFAGFALYAGLALACQENVGLILAAFAFLALLQGRRGCWFWAPLLAGTAHFGLTVFVVLPRLNQTVQFNLLYGHFGDSLPQALLAMVCNPRQVVETLLAPGKPEFLTALLAPLAFISLVGIEGLIPALPIFAQRLLSARPSESSIVYHYQAEFIPFIFLAAIYGLARIRRAGPAAPRVLAAVLPLMTLITWLVTQPPARLSEPIRHTLRHWHALTHRRALLDRIPADAPVIATFRFLPHLVNRAGLYSLHHIYTGRYTLSHQPYVQPPADYMVLDTRDPLTFSPVNGFYDPAGAGRLLAFLAPNGWHTIAEEDGVLLFKRSTIPALLLVPTIRTAELPPPGQRTVLLTGAGPSVRLADFTLHIAPDDPTSAELTLFWQTPAWALTDFDLDIVLTGADGQSLYAGRLAPGNRLWSPPVWSPDHTLADHHHLRLRTPYTGAPDAPLTLNATLIPLPAPPGGTP